MNSLELNDFTRLWRRIGEQAPRPRAILMVSAHWFIGATAITAMARPRTIHDFYGFPEALFNFDYPAVGSPSLAQEIQDIVKPMWAGLDRDQWGLDHGAWSVLTHLYPNADIPVVQLAINALKPLDYHLELAARLAPLRDQGVMIVTSGNVVHNLRLVRWDEPDIGFDWARRFDEAVVRQLADDPGGILRVTGHADFGIAVPTPDHFIPLLYLAGLAAAGGGGVQPLIQGYALGSLSMTCFGVGLDEIECQQGEGSASLPVGIPADQTNI